MESRVGSNDFLFVNAGTLTKGANDTRRKIRSQLMRRVYWKHKSCEENPETSHVLDDDHVGSSQGQRITRSSPLPPSSPSDTIGRVASVKALDYSTRAKHMVRTPRAYPAQSYFSPEQLARSDPLATLGASKINPFYDQSSTFNLPHYEELCAHCENNTSARKRASNLTTASF